MLRDSYYMLASSLLRFFATGLLFILLARLWGAEIFGAFMYAFTIAFLVVLVVDYGFALQLVRDIARFPERADEITNNALRAKIVLALLSVLIVSAIALYLPNSHQFPVLLWLLTVAAIAGSFGLLFNLPFRALGLFHQETRVMVASNAIHLALASSLALIGQGPQVIAGAFAISRFAYLAMSWREYRRVVPMRSHGSAGYVKLTSTLRGGFPFCVHTALSALYFQVDTLIIHHYLGSQGVGMYQAALRIIMAALIPVDVLTNVYLPRLARHTDNRKILAAVGSRMTRHMLLVGAIGGVMIMALAQPGVTLLYGSEYASSARLVSSLAVVFFCVILADHMGRCSQSPTVKGFVRLGLVLR